MVIDILQKHNKDVVVNYLSKLQDIDKVELAAMDMRRPYKDALIMVIPHAKIVIDKFQVIKLANESLEKHVKLIVKMCQPKNVGKL